MKILAVFVFLVCLMPSQGFAEAISGAGDYTKEEVHGIKQNCDICHLSHKMKVVSLLKEPVSVLCIRCHPNRNAYLVDVDPSMDVEGLPLTGGKMTCVTCHDSHKNTYKNMLRVKPKGLCLKCHKY